MDDRGLAELATALHHFLPDALSGCSPQTVVHRQQHLLDAAAILGERGVFLPDGLPIPADCMAPDVHHEWTGPMRSCGCPNAREQAATIATLRGAYREAADWITAVQSHYVLGPEASPEDIFMVAGERQEAELATLRAALDRIWRANHVVHSAYDGECEHGFGPPATLCPNNGCPDKELAEAWSAALATAKEAGDVR